tara:strand:- start:5 stop:583 length:579 start_codon:yes stop_codon:yes gene_type:complete
MNFIGIYDDIITLDECNVIRQYHERHPDKEKGQIGYGFVDPDLKDSTDVYTRFTESLLTHRILYGALEQAFKRYESEHTCMTHTDRFSLHDSFNIQKYDPGGGFKLWHHETTNFANYPNLQTTRVLAWMVNLNDCPGGGTMFMDQDFTMEAKCGRLSLWPAGFTHVHKGQISETHEKYIATGWFNYDTPNFK